MSERFPHVICQRDFQLLMAPRLAYTDKEKGERGGEERGEDAFNTIKCFYVFRFTHCCGKSRC